MSSAVRDRSVRAMPPETRERARRLWGALNAALGFLVVGHGAVFVFLVLALGTDHSEVAAEKWLL